MKITRIKGHAISKPLGTTLYMANQVVSACSQIIVEVQTDDGITGVATVHGRSMPQVLQALHELESVIGGMDAMAHEAVWHKIFSLTTMPAQECLGVGWREVFLAHTVWNYSNTRSLNPVAFKMPGFVGRHSDPRGGITYNRIADCKVVESLQPAGSSK